MSRRPRKRTKPLTEEQIRSRRRTKALINKHHVEAVRDGMKQRRDQAPGTSPNALGLVKAASEEARLAICTDCGYASGRHSRSCARAQD